MSDDTYPNMVLTEDEVDKEAWKIVLTGAESHWEDWIDEFGDFNEVDEERVYLRARELIRSLKDTVEMLLNG